MDGTSNNAMELCNGVTSDKIAAMHIFFSVAESCIPAEVIAAIDINTVANEVYKHNFPSTHLYPKTIEGMTLDDFNRLDFDMILMSPPCQPFTRIGSQKDVLDPRTKSFLYILDILPRLSKTPKYILLENVKGFETSVARDKLIQTLESCGYNYQEFLLTPTCLGIPNSRLRYFLIAKLQPGAFCFQTILEGFPHHERDDWKHKCQEMETLIYKLETSGHLERKLKQNNNLSIQMIQDFLEEKLQNPSQYLISPKVLMRYALVLDIVGLTCRRSVCFTKGYGHYAEGTGSVLQTASDVELSTVFQEFETLSENEKLAQLSKLKLRYFTPREIANLHGFPAEFNFPEKISVKQSYRLLGNSLNIHVVAKLIELLVQ
uniref:tRNA (cytosine(38)-C(5))-methyltransferase n=1 Tax=Callorhinchus milii TaxID=7868 RepID=A0A4W3JRB0_CALMI